MSAPIASRVLTDGDNFLPHILGFVPPRERAVQQRVNKEWLLASTRLFIAVSSRPTRALRTMRTLQAALAAAAPGEVIKLDPGRYEGPFFSAVPFVTVTCPEGRATLVAADHRAPLEVFSPARFVNLEFLATDGDVWDPTSAVEERPDTHSAVRVRADCEVVFEGCSFSRPQGYGVAAHRLGHAALGCVAAPHAHAALLRPLMHAAPRSPRRLVSCVFHDAAVGVDAAGFDRLEVRSSKFASNVWGLNLDDTRGSGQPLQVIVDECTFQRQRDVAIRVVSLRRSAILVSRSLLHRCRYGILVDAPGPTTRQRTLFTLPPAPGRPRVRGRAAPDDLVLRLPPRMCHGHATLPAVEHLSLALGTRPWRHTLLDRQPPALRGLGRRPRRRPIARATTAARFAALLPVPALQRALDAEAAQRPGPPDGEGLRPAPKGDVPAVAAVAVATEAEVGRGAAVPAGVPAPVRDSHGVPCLPVVAADLDESLASAWCRRAVLAPGAMPVLPSHAHTGAVTWLFPELSSPGARLRALMGCGADSALPADLADTAAATLADAAFRGGGPAGFPSRRWSTRAAWDLLWTGGLPGAEGEGTAAYTPWAALLLAGAVGARHPCGCALHTGHQIVVQDTEVTDCHQSGVAVRAGSPLALRGCVIARCQVGLHCAHPSRHLHQAGGGAHPADGVAVEGTLLDDNEVGVLLSAGTLALWRCALRSTVIDAVPDPTLAHATSLAGAERHGSCMPPGRPPLRVTPRPRPFSQWTPSTVTFSARGPSSGTCRAALWP